MVCVFGGRKVPSVGGSRWQLMGIELLLTEGGLRKYLGWLKLEKIVCARCGGDILPGDMIHRSGKVFAFRNPWEKRCHPLGGCRFWHLECYEGLFV